MLPFTNMSQIKSYFSDLGFRVKSHNKITNHAALVVDIDLHNGFIIVKSCYDGNKFIDESAILRHLGRDIRYLMIIDTDVGAGMFVKHTLGSTGHIKFQKYRFNKNSRTAATLIGALKPETFYSFEDLFNTEKIVANFYSKYTKHLSNLVDSLEGISNADDKKHYADVIMSRLMFIQFLQTRNFFQNKHFLLNKFAEINHSNESYYKFLRMLFFDILNKPKTQRPQNLTEYSNIAFLNGGLFKVHSLEHNYSKINIPNQIIFELLTFLKDYTWYVDETNVFSDGINPEILGHIFEKTINDQKQKGAFYTPVDVTQFICDHTIISYCIEQLNIKFSTNYELHKNSINEICQNFDQAHYLYFKILKPLTILDNACGSGAFLLTAFGLLLNLYEYLWKSICNSTDASVQSEFRFINKYSSVHYYFRRRIVTENLFGVDVDEGAIEVCRLRLWLGLVADMDVENPEPLPNIDYNILLGNSLLGFVNSQPLQSDLISNIPTKKDYKQIVTLKKLYNNTSDPQRASSIKNRLDPLITTCREQLNAALYMVKKKIYCTPA